MGGVCSKNGARHTIAPTKIPAQPEKPPAPTTALAANANDHPDVITAGWGPRSVEEEKRSESENRGPLNQAEGHPDKSNGERQKNKAVRRSSGSMKSLLGLSAPRQQRPRWKEVLEREPEECEKEHPDEGTALEILGGTVSESALARPSRIVSFFLSSTYTDTVHERNLVMFDVLPYLQDYARRRGLELRTSEMRWGVRESTHSDHRTFELCMQELERCQRTSMSLSYVLLACDKYGYRPLPRTLGKEVFGELLAFMSEGERVLVCEHYRVDDNDVAAEGAYVLKNMQGVEGWYEKSAQVQASLRDAARRVWPDVEQELRDPHAKHPAQELFQSVTEAEVYRGLLWRKDRNRVACMFKRVLEGVAEGAGDGRGGEGGEEGLEQTERVQDYFDVRGDGGLDVEALGLLREMHSKVASVLDPSRVREYRLRWQVTRVEDDRERREYLCNFTDDFCQVLVDSLDSAGAELARQPAYPQAVEEAASHLRFCTERAAAFVHTQSTQSAVEAVLSHLAQDSPARDALILHAPSGAGKTSVAARAVCTFLEGGGGRGVNVVVRFVSTTPQSSSVNGLLGSLCEQLLLLYGSDGGTGRMPIAFSDLCLLFAKMIKKAAAAAKRLVLVIDALDRLDGTLEWLPVSAEKDELPSNVRVVVTTLEDSVGGAHAPLAVLRRRLEGRQGSFVRVQKLSEPGKVLDQLLGRRGRRLTELQRAAVLEGFKGCVDGSALWVGIVASLAERWHSYDACEVQSSVSGLIGRLFDEAEQHHGMFIVSATAAYISLSVRGVSEVEVSELLSLEDDVLADSYEWWVPPVRVIPPLLPVALLSRLAPHLCLRHTGGLQWAHAQFRACAVSRYASGDAATKRHSELADYFSGVWSGARSKPYNEWLRKRVQRPNFFPGEVQGDRKAPAQPLVLSGSLLATRARINERRVGELVTHLIRAGREEECVRSVCALDYITAKFRLGEGHSLISELSEALEAFPDSLRTLTPARAFVGRRLAQLLQLRVPNMVYQLALQEADVSGIRHAAMDAQKTGCGLLYEWAERPPEIDQCTLTVGLVKGALAVAWAPDDRRLAAGLLNSMIKIIDGLTGAVLASLEGHSGGITGLDFSPDSKFLCSGGNDNLVILWDVDAGLPKHVLNVHKNMPFRMSFCPSGLVFSSGACDNTVRVWDIESGREVCPALQHEGMVEGTAWSKKHGEERVLFSTGIDLKVRKWDTTTGAELREPCALECPLIGMLDAGDGVLVLFDIAGNLHVFGSSLFTVLWTVKTPHSAMCLGMAMTKDGTQLALSSDDELISVWDTSDLRISGFRYMHSLRGHNGAVKSVAYNSHGLLASASEDSTVKLWDSGLLLLADEETAVAKNTSQEDGDEVGRVKSAANEAEAVSGAEESLSTSSGQRFAGGVRCLALSADGKELYAGLTDGGIVRYCTENQQAKGEPIGAHSAQVMGLSMSCDGVEMISCSGDGTVKRWDRQGRQLGDTIVVGEYVMCCAFSPTDPRCFATSNTAGSKSPDVLMLWTLVDEQGAPSAGGAEHTNSAINGGADDAGAVGQEESDECAPGGNQKVSKGAVEKVVIPFEKAQGFMCMCWTPGGVVLAAGGVDGMLCVFDTVKREPLFSSRIAAVVTSIAVSRSGRHLLAGSCARVIQVFDLRTYEKLCESPVVHNFDVTSVRECVDGRVFSTGLDGSVLCWRVGEAWTSMTLNKEVGSHEAAANCMLVAESNSTNDRGKGMVVYSGGDDKVVCAWDGGPDAKSGCAAHKPLSFRDVGVMSVAVGNGLVASGGVDKKLTLSRCSGTGQKGVEVGAGAVGSYVRALSFGGGVLCSGSDDGVARVWKGEDGVEAAQLRHGDHPVRAVAVSQSGGKAASGGDDCVVKIWDLHSRKLERELSGHTRWIKGVAWTPDSSVLVSCSDDASIRVWEANTGGLHGVLEGHADCVLGVCVSPSGTTIASGARDGSLALWDVQTLKQKGRPIALSGPVVAVAYRSEDLLLSCSGTEMLVWDLRVGTGASPVGGFYSPSRLKCVALDRGSGLTVCGDEEGTVHHLWG